jgi:ferritin-like metal-binding protein YciE
MRAHTIEEQLTAYLADVHSIEVQALAQMKAAPKLTGDGRLSAVFREHLDETREQERLVREHLERRGADTSTLKDLAGRVGGWAMIAFARLNPDTPGKLAAHAFAYEHMELAAYELLRRVAERAHDEPVIELTRLVGSQEQAMADRLAGCFDEAVDLSLAQKDDPIGEQLASYLTDARAIEAQAAQLLQAGPRIVGVPALADAFRDHLAETREHQVLLEERLRARDARPSRFQNTALRLGAVNLGVFFAAQPDTPVKLGGFAYAFEHLEIAAYELLRRVADRVDDSETAAVAERILADERRATERVAATWDAAVDAVLGDLVGDRVR